MKNTRLTIYLIIAVLFVITDQGLALIEFKGGGTYNINYTISDTVWVDYLLLGNQTTVNVLNGGVIIGELAAYNNSRITMGGGTVTDRLEAHGNSHVTMNNGSAGNSLWAYDNSQVTMSGGSINKHLRALDNSNITMTGGVVTEDLSAYDSSTITLFGYDFGTSSGLSLVGDKVIGIGILTGKWSNGVDFIMPITANATTANIYAIPEPCTLLLLGVGGLLIRKQNHN